jgi:DNA-binding beta-propeller fold protein YncE
MRIMTGLALLTMLLTAVVRGQETNSPALLVLHKGDKTMAIVDPSTGKVLGRVQTTARDPHELAVSADGTLAVASNYSGDPQTGNSLSVIDIAGRTEKARIDLNPLSRPHGLWFAAGKFYFTVEANNAIGRYDPASNKVDWVLGTGEQRTHMIVVSKDAKTIYTSNVSSDTISIIEPAPRGGFGGPPPGGPGGFGGPPPGGPGGPPPGRGPGGTGWKQTLVKVGRGPEGFDVSPDGKQLWTGHMADGKISVVDLASKKAVKTIDAGARALNRLKFTPDGSLALVSDIFGGEVIIIDVASHAVKARVKVGRGASGILIPPGGSRAFVASTGESVIAVIDLKSLAEVARFNTGPGPDGMAWLPGK